tara:strand:+ start:2552 stop:5380 length:2829 start_codon:yes stop_codon:yes gene_type:complete
MNGILDYLQDKKKKALSYMEQDPQMQVLSGVLGQYGEEGLDFLQQRMTGILDYFKDQDELQSFLGHMQNFATGEDPLTQWLGSSEGTYSGDTNLETILPWLSLNESGEMMGQGSGRMAENAPGILSGETPKDQIDSMLGVLQGAGETAMGGVEAVVPGAKLLSMLPLGAMIKAFHGTPHKVDKFKMDKIGTGEGVQAYGNGLYFAENPKVAGDYKKKLSSGVMVEGEPISANLSHHISIDKSGNIDQKRLSRAIKDRKDGLLGRNSYQDELDGWRDYERAYGSDAGDMPDHLRSKEAWDAEIAKESKGLELLEKAQANPSGISQSEGNLYNVNLNVEPEDLLDWDAPLSEQSEGIKKLIDQTMSSQSSGANSAAELSGDIRGSEWYKMMGHGDFNQASARLKKQGIPGIKYLDGNSRNAGEGTRNFVMFDEDLIEMADKDILPITPPKGEVLLDADKGVLGDDKVTGYHGSASAEGILGDVYTTEDLSQAKLYGENITELKYNKSSIATEEQARKYIKDLGLNSREPEWNLDELNLFEIIDPNFETSLAPADIEKLRKAMRKDGFEGINFTDTNLDTYKQDAQSTFLFRDGEQGKPIASSPPKGEVLLDADKGVLDGLPTDYASRMQRAKEQGFDRDVYHASTHDIDAFDLNKANPESDMGAGIYTTTSPYDASENYSDLTGADLTQKIEMRAEQLEYDLGDMDKAREAAKAEIYGEASNVMPLKARLENPVHVGGGDETTWLEMNQREFDVEDYMDEAKLNIERADYDDVADYKEALTDAANDLGIEDSYNFEPEGKLIDFMESLRNSAEIHGGDASKSIDEIYQAGMDGGINADDIMEIIRKDEGLMDAAGESGELMNHEIMRQAFEDAGFDGIIDSGVYNKWGHGSGRQKAMEGMEYDTQHVIPFKPEQLRSPNATFDPKKINDPDLLSMNAGILQRYI